MYLPGLRRLLGSKLNLIFFIMLNPEPKSPHTETPALISYGASWSMRCPPIKDTKPRSEFSESIIEDTSPLIDTISMPLPALADI